MHAYIYIYILWISYINSKSDKILLSQKNST